MYITTSHSSRSLWLGSSLSNGSRTTGSVRMVGHHIHGIQYEPACEYASKKRNHMRILNMF